jgi:hypothetical protein
MRREGQFRRQKWPYQIEEYFCGAPRNAKLEMLFRAPTYTALLIWTAAIHAPRAQTATAPSFHDDFEADRNWFLFEEVVGGNTCYGTNLGTEARTTDRFLSPTHSLRLWANQSGQFRSNHVSAVHRVAYAGRTGKWRYQVSAFIDPATAIYQSGPEFSAQNTRNAPSGLFLTYTGAVQYQASPYLPDHGSWRVWGEVAPGQAAWLPLGYVPLATGQWYTLTLDIDFDTNRYLRFTVQGSGVSQVFDLTDIRIAGQNMFSEETFDITVEGENLWNNCGTDTVWESKLYYDDIDLALSPTPAAVSVTPNSGTGLRNTFTFHFAAADSNHPLSVVNVLINQWLDGVRSCYLAYSQPDNLLYLVNDAGTDLLPALLLNGSGNLANTACSIHGAGSSAVASGGGLDLKLDIDFAADAWGSNHGDRIIYMAARDQQSANSGWQVEGVWRVPSASPLLPDAFLQSAAGGSGVEQVFTAVFHAAAAATGFKNVQLLINRDLDGRGACWVGFDPTSNLIYLVDDGGAVLPALQAGTVGSRENSQCRVNALGSSAAISATDLILNLDLSFEIPFSPRLVYGAASGDAGYNSPWICLGTWSVP